MCHTDRSDLGAAPYFHKDFLQFPTGQAVEHTERFIEQQELWRQRESARDTNALLHAVGKVGRRLKHGVSQTNTVKVVGDDVVSLRFAGVGVDPIDTE